VGSIEPLLPDSPLSLGPVKFVGGPLLDVADPRLELLLSGQARPKGGIEAISFTAQRFQLVEPQPIRRPLLECGADPIPLGADMF
jgi:hypothetical protein